MAGMQFNTWWVDDPEERFWLETTGRDQLGVDLNAPQRDRNGQENHSYSLIHEIHPGDIVFHYWMNERAIVGWSRAAGSVWDAQVVWKPHAGEPVQGTGEQPGWYLGLEGCFPIEPAVSQERLRLVQDQIRAVRVELQGIHGPSLYFPFELSAKRPLRATQFYIRKMPKRVVDLLFDAAAVARFATPSASAPIAASIQAPTSELGTDYRTATEEHQVTERDPFNVDPSVVDRGVRGHATTQNALASYLRTKGLVPKSPRPEEPQFDVGWSVGSQMFVAEVKSLTDANEEGQLRLGLGQVLRYRGLLAATGESVTPVLMVEREPGDPTWKTLCASHGVILAWPASLASAL